MKQNKKNENKMKASTKFTILAIILIAIFSFVISPITLQNDTYYTIKIGEHIFQNGIDMKDPFSWHENLPYTYPHWLYDLLTYFVYSLFSFKGICIITAILSMVLGISIFMVNKNLSRNEVISFVVTIGTMYLLKDYITARAQLVTFILFILEIYFIEKFLQTRNKKYAIGLIIMSILIANLHAAVWPFMFVLFLPYIGEWLVINISDIVLYKKLQMRFNKIRLKMLIKKNKNQDKINKLKEHIEKEELQIEKIKSKRKEYNKNPYKIRIIKNENAKWLILIMVLCALMGLLTPIGDAPYTYLSKTMLGNTTENINEHLPITLIQNEEILCVLTIFLAILIFTNTKIKLSDLFMLGGLTFLMLSSKRQSSIFVLICSIILSKMLVDVSENYFKDFNKRILKVFTTKIGMYCIIAIVLIISGTFIKDKKDDTIIDESSYPVDACDYILENVDIQNMKLYNDYNYGSYILYRDIPVFIDSRADLYAPEFNSPTGDPKDGQDIFMDFLNTSQGSTYCEDTFKKYNITHILVPKNSKVNMAITKADNSKYHKLYQDSNFVLYQRN